MASDSPDTLTPPSPTRPTHASALSTELRLAVMRLGRRLRYERAATGDLGLSSLSVLGVLMREGETTIGELAGIEGVRPPSMTRTVSCLEAEGLVQRRPHTTDGRQVLVCLTETGEQRIVADRRLREAWLDRHLAGLSAEEVAVLREAAPILMRLATE